MSKEQADAFRKFVNENEPVQERIINAAADGSLKLTKLAAEHGFEFTAEEAETALKEKHAGELTDLLVDMFRRVW